MAVDRGSRAPPQRSNEPVLPMNEKIKADPLRVVIAKGGDEGDEMLGVISLQEARAKAQELEKDLVMISPKSDPPVCKIVDYGKLKYQMDRKKKDNLKKTKVNELKEVKMSYKIESHDYQVRRRNAEKFLNSGSRVKAVVQFRGREQQYMNLGVDLLNKLAEDVSSIGNGEKPKREGNRMIMFINPIQEKLANKGGGGGKEKMGKKERQQAKAAKALAKQNGSADAAQGPKEAA